jgi:tripartite-type tricarboxylate transporter receptor subunit TctC
MSSTRPQRRGVLALLAGLPWLAARDALAQGYPDHPIRLVVPYAPGAAADQLARVLARPLAQALGQPVVIDNRAGAGGTLGADMAAKAPADGYTLLLGTDATQATNLHLARKFPYDPLRHFTPLASAAINPIVLVVHPSLPVRSVAELIQYAKAHPRTLSYGSSGIGTPHHLAGELLNERAGIAMVHVPYKGGAPAMTDLLGDTINVLFASLATALPYIQNGQVRALAVTQAQSHGGLPQIPTIGETLTGYALTGWLGFFAPTGLPAPIQARLHVEINKALADNAVRSALEQAGLVPSGSTPQALAALVRQELATRGRLVKAAGIEPE